MAVVTALTPWRRWRGTWQPGASSAASVLIFHVLLAWTALIRGVDYLTGSDDVASLGWIERAMPLHYWGLLLVGASALVYGGMLGRWWSSVILGHALGFGCYLAIGVGIALDTGLGDGFRTWAGLIFGGAAYHLLFAVGGLLRLWDMRAAAEYG